MTALQFAFFAMVSSILFFVAVACLSAVAFVLLFIGKVCYFLLAPIFNALSDVSSHISQDIKPVKKTSKNPVEQEILAIRRLGVKR